MVRADLDLKIVVFIFARPFPFSFTEECRSSFEVLLLRVGKNLETRVVFCTALSSCYGPKEVSRERRSTLLQP